MFSNKNKHAESGEGESGEKPVNEASFPEEEEDEEEGEGALIQLGPKYTLKELNEIDKVLSLLFLFFPFSFHFVWWIGVLF